MEGSDPVERRLGGSGFRLEMQCCGCCDRTDQELVECRSWSAIPARLNRTSLIVKWIQTGIGWMSRTIHGDHGELALAPLIRIEVVLRSNRRFVECARCCDVSTMRPNKEQVRRTTIATSSSEHLNQRGMTIVNVGHDDIAHTLSVNTLR